MATDLRFQWDPRKAEGNKRKHRVSFEVAAMVFDDPLVHEFGEGTEHGEIRYRAIGEVLGKCLAVSYTTFEEDGEETIRIISARAATPRERRAYERNSQAHR